MTPRPLRDPQPGPTTAYRVGQACGAVIAALLFLLVAGALARAVLWVWLAR